MTPMDRKRIERELSLHLDGRLPSGRREAILDHLADDPESARVFAEMDRASELARSLPGQVVSPNFARDLWDRVRSGEGTPDASFREPLPLLVKTRYVLAGAAAAALVILGVNLFARTTTPLTAPSEVTGQLASGSPTERSIPEAPSAPSSESTHPNGLRPVGLASMASFPDVLMPVTAWSVTRAGHSEWVGAMRDLKERFPSAERRLATVAFDEVAQQIEPVVERARGSMLVMRWLQNERIVKLQPDIDVTLRIAEQIIDRIERANAGNDAMLLRVAADDIRTLDLGPLDREIDVTCCNSTDEFLDRFRAHFVVDPRACRVFRIESPSIDLMNFGHVTPGNDRDPFSEALIRVRILRR